jgi:aminoglycoside phosphotransferase (APT) family kinase protein
MAALLTRVRAAPIDPAAHALVNEAEAFYAAHRDALIPAGGPRQLHGDLHLSNVIADHGRVTGVIDWEWAPGGEPDFDLADLVRWSLYPEDPAEKSLEERVSRRDYAPLIPLLMAAYPGVTGMPHFRDRTTIYLIEYDLHMLSRSPREPHRPLKRLQGWLRGRALDGHLP